MAFQKLLERGSEGEPPEAFDAPPPTYHEAVGEHSLRYIDVSSGDRDTLLLRSDGVSSHTLAACQPVAQDTPHDYVCTHSQQLSLSVLPTWAICKLIQTTAAHRHPLTGRV
jgi:hypothetical protein